MWIKNNAKIGLILVFFVVQLVIANREKSRRRKQIDEQFENGKFQKQSKN